MSTFAAYMRERQAAAPHRIALADSAIALGVPVFPCAADKRPLTTRGFKDASADPDAIRAMFNRPDAALIGVPTGAASGWCVVDVDVKEGARGMHWLNARSADLVATRRHKTQSGGLHLVFTVPDGVEVRNSASRVAPGVDVRGEGGYVIAPPSPGYSVADASEPAEMPDWLVVACGKPERDDTAHLLASPANAERLRRSIEGGTAYGRTALENECASISGAADGTKHERINRGAYAIGGLVAAGELPEGEAFAALSGALAAILPACRDKRAAENTLRRAFEDGKRAARQPPPEMVPPPEEVHPAAGLIAKLNARAAKAQAKPLDVPPGIMDVDGALGLFVDHCNATAISPQPLLALAAGISMIGVLAGRKYRTATDLRTNVYTVGVAGSGGGKDHARKMVKKCLAAAGLTQYLGGEDIASGQAIYTALSRHPCVLFQIDEFGNWLSGVLGPKAAAHKAAIAEGMKKLYSEANSFTRGTEYADQSRAGKPREDIQQPHACLHATTTPGQLWDAVKGASLKDGLFARIQIFVSPCSYPDEREPSDDPLPAALVDALKAIAAGAGGEVGNLAALGLPGTVPEPYAVPNSPDAQAAYLALRKEQTAMQRRGEGAEHVESISGRLAENAMKFALIRAVSRDPAAPVIAGGDVAWGRAVALHCIETLLREAQHNVAENDFEAKLLKALNILRKHGRPMTAREMFRKGLKLPDRERDEVLRALVGNGLALETRQEAAPNGGRPAVRYSAALVADEGLEAEG